MNTEDEYTKYPTYVGSLRESYPPRDRRREWRDPSLITGITVNPVDSHWKWSKLHLNDPLRKGEIKILYK